MNNQNQKAGGIPGQISSIALQAIDLSQKNNYIRSGAKSLMDQWEKISECGEELKSETILAPAYLGEGFLLHSGKSEILSWRQDQERWIDYKEQERLAKEIHWTAKIEMPLLREALKKLPQAINEIAGQMALAQKDNQSLLDMIQSMEINSRDI